MKKNIKDFIRFSRYLHDLFVPGRIIGIRFSWYWPFLFFEREILTIDLDVPFANVIAHLYQEYIPEKNWEKNEKENEKNFQEYTKKTLVIDSKEPKIELHKEAKNYWTKEKISSHEAKNGNLLERINILK